MKIDHMVKSVFIVALTLVLVGVIALVAMWGHRIEIAKIRPDGPFGDRFSDLYGEGPGSMAEYRSERLENWFRSVLPVGTDRAKCRNILKESFGADLTSGDFVVIDKMSIFPSGGEDTKVRLIFDRHGRFQDVEVRQNRSWASVYPEPKHTRSSQRPVTFFFEFGLSSPPCMS